MPKIGNKNNNNTSVPTLAEYISTQLAGKRAAALDKSRNRTSVRVPMISNYETEEHWKHRLNTTIQNAEELLSRLMASGENGDYAKAKQQELDALLEELDKGYPKLIAGANCMYNAGDCYGLNIPGNETFAAKHKELGFQKTPKGSMEPGDLVQDVRMGYPTHAMIYDSKDDENNLLFNYARGYNSTSVEENYVKQGKYPLPIKDYDVYKYVGTPADSTQWINEYKQRYGNGMRCGGRRKAQLGLDIREGGVAIPIAPNMYYMDGRSHDNGGIAIGPNNKNGLEVEGGEVVKVGNNDIKVFSSVPLLRGVSPAQLVMGGANPDAVFKAQEEFKDRNRINDDGTRYEVGGEKRIYTPSKSIQRQIQETGRITIGGSPTIGGLRTAKYVRGLANAKSYAKQANKIFTKVDNFVNNSLQGLINKHKITPNQADAYKKFYNEIVGVNGVNIPKTASFFLNNDNREMKFGGSMIYTINGNVKNSLMSARPKARYGTINKKDKDTKVGQDGLIYKRAADGEWYTDGTKHVAFKEIENSTRTARRDIFKATEEDEIDWIGDENNKFISSSSNVPTVGKKVNLKLPKPKRTYVGGYDEEEKETKKVGSLTYEKNESGKWVPSAKQSTTTTRDGGRPKDFGMTRTGVNHPNGSYKYHPLTGEKISEMGVVETSEPSVKGTTKVSSKSSSTARGRGTKASTSKVASQSTPTIQDTVNKITMDAWKASKTPKIDLSKVEMPSYNVSNLGSKETKTAKAKLNSPSTGGVKEATWVPQYNLINTRDWLGVGTNLAGHIASYFANNALLKKAPMPVKPVQFQAAKLKTTHNINPELANINEVTQMNLAEVGRNTASSNTSIARKQRIMNEARDARNKLYGQKENIETQLINLDRRNRQDVYNRNIAAYNNWLDKTYVAKSNNLLNKQRNLTNLISGIPMAVNTMLGTIESRKSTNDMIQAMSASRPNVDGRLLGIGDYYSQKLPDGRTAIYNKNHKLVKYV